MNDEQRVQLALKITKHCKLYEEGSIPDDIGMTIVDMISRSTVTDEEIEKEAKERYLDDPYTGLVWIDGAKWLRERLTQ